MDTLKNPGSKAFVLSYQVVATSHQPSADQLFVVMVLYPWTT